MSPFQEPEAAQAAPELVRGDELATDAPAEAPDRAALARAIAELENARARLARDAQGVLDETRHKLVAQLLPILDNLDRAIAAGAESPAEGAVLEGVILVRDQLEALLREYGLQRFDPLGERFDPRVHEAVGVVSVDTPARTGTVADVWQAGYRLGDRVLRPAKVRVGRY